MQTVNKSAALRRMLLVILLAVSTLVHGACVLNTYYPGVMKLSAIILRLARLTNPS